MNLTVLKALDRVHPSRIHSMLNNKMSQSSLLIVLAMFWLLFCGNGCFPSSPAMWKTLSAMRPDLEETPLEDVLLRLMACSTNRCCQYMITLLTLLKKRRHGPVFQVNVYRQHALDHLDRCRRRPGLQNGYGSSVLCESLQTIANGSM